MVTEQQEYYNMLYKIYSNNPPTVILTPKSDDTIYEINLNTREIEAPLYLGVEEDHKAEIIYFRVPRFFDNMDLSTTSCIIEYKNANGDIHIYIPPYYDIDTLSLGGTKNPYAEMLIPWELLGPITETSGKVYFAFKFFKADGHYILTTISESDFIPNYYYIIENNNFKIAKGFYADYTYYQKELINEKDVYTEISLTENTYKVNTYYRKAEDIYTISTSSSFKSSETYYELNDNGEYEEKELTESSYAANKYYVKTEGAYFLDTGFNENELYYILSSNLTYLLNTKLASSQVLESANFEEKYIISDVNEFTYISGYYYKKDSEGRYYLCEDDEYNAKETYYEFSVPEVNLDDSLVTKATIILNRLESMNNSLDLYWEVL